MSIFEGFKFKYVDTKIHRLNPITKFLLALALSAEAMIFSQISLLAVILFVETLLVSAAKLGKQYVMTLKAASAFALIVFSLNFFFSRDAVHSVAMTFRWLCFFSAFTTFFLTTSPDDLGVSMEQAHVPYALTFPITTAVRFIPVLANDLVHVMDSQRSRGVDFGTMNPIKAVKNAPAALIPLIAGAIRRSLEVSEAMDSRAFGVRRRTLVYVPEFRALDLLIISLLFIFVREHSFPDIRLIVPV